MQRKRKKNRGNQGIELQKKLVRFVLILGAIVLLIIFFFGDHGVYQLYRLNAEKAEIQNAITNLREEKRQLGNEKIRLESDYEYIEELEGEYEYYEEDSEEESEEEKIFKLVSWELGKKNISIINSKIGIAVKDNSITVLENVNLSNITLPIAVFVPQVFLEDTHIY